MIKKIIILIVLVILSIPISMYISYFLDSVLSSKSFEILDIRDLIFIILNNSNMIKFTILILALITMLFFMLIFVPKNSLLKTETQKITNNITIPKNVRKRSIWDE